MAFVRTALIIVALLMGWTALRAPAALGLPVETSAHS